MSDTDGQVGRSNAAPIMLGQHLVDSQSFKALFVDGMSLVEETADYLDGQGKRDFRELSHVGSLAYATESMRLTTRLMQLASWLLLQRAANEGEITVEQAAAEKTKVKLNGFASATGGAGWDDLPDRLRQLIARSTRLQERIRRLDKAARQDARAVESDNPVARQRDRIAAAFGVE